MAIQNPDGKLLPDNWSIDRDEKGNWQGKRSYLVNPADMFDVNLPEPGDIWTAFNNVPEMTELICKSASWNGYDAGLAYITYNYNSEKPDATTIMEISIDYRLESEDYGRGCLWLSDGARVDQDVATQVPVMVYSITLNLAEPPRAAAALAQRCVNDAVWHGFPRGTLRFDGCRVDEQRGFGGVLINATTTFDFVAKCRDHNLYWRKPQPLYLSNGNTVNYQNDDSAGAYYTTDPLLIGKPVIQVAAKLDVPMEAVNTPRHPYIDFTDILGIPRLPGDSI